MIDKIYIIRLDNLWHMKKFISILFINLFSIGNLLAQDLIGEEFKQLFHAIQASEEKKFSSQLVSTRETFEILKLGMQSEGNTVEWGNIPFSSDQDSLVASKILMQLIKQADSMGINLKEAVYVDCYYSISKQPGSLLSAMKGKIFFKYANQYYTLGIEEAILWKQQWKIMAFSGFEKLENAFENAVERITDFGFFDRNIKIENIKIEVIGDESPPPPPPPPPPPVNRAPTKKQKGRINLPVGYPTGRGNNYFTLLTRKVPSTDSVPI